MINTIDETISALKEIQEAGVAIEEASVTLHKKEGVSINLIAGAVSLMQSIHVDDAQLLVKEWIDKV